jgi:TRAP-type mannitol/chloroaromatic compound transport system permease small subunit
MMRTIIRTIDSLTERTAKLFRWLCAILVLLVTLEVTMRYVFNSPTMWNYETSMFIGGTFYAIGLSFAHLRRSHVRIDLLYGRLSPKKRAIIDILGWAFLFMPLIGLTAYVSVDHAIHSWVIGERSVQTYWDPPLAPFRTAVAFGICLFALQGVAQFLRDLLVLKGDSYDD